MKVLETHPVILKVLTTFALIAVPATLVLWSWNSFAPDVLGLDAIGFKQALGLTLLSLVVGRLVAGGGHYRFPGQAQG